MISFNRVISTVSALNSQFSLMSKSSLNDSVVKQLFREYMIKLKPILLSDSLAIVKAYKRDKYNRIVYMRVKLTLSKDIYGNPLITVEYI
jgi:hypothetical protein